MIWRPEKSEFLNQQSHLRIIGKVEISNSPPGVLSSQRQIRLQVLEEQIISKYEAC